MRGCGVLADVISAEGRYKPSSVGRCREYADEVPSQGYHGPFLLPQNKVVAGSTPASRA